MGSTRPTGPRGLTRLDETVPGDRHGERLFPLAGTGRLVAVGLAILIWSLGLPGLGAAGVLITNVGQFYRLSSAAARQGAPVRLVGVVTYADLEWNTLFIHDGAEGFHIVPKGIALEPRPGQLVEVTGRTAQEDRWRHLAEPALRVLGNRPLPQPIIATELALSTGILSAKWVEVTAVVRRALDEAGRLRLDLMIGNTRLVSYVRTGPGTAYDFNALLGARVKVRGVCAVRFVGEGIEGVGILIPTMKDLEVIARPPAAMSAMPITAIRQLREPPLPGEATAMVRVSGVVAGKQNLRFVLRDATNSVLVNCYRGLSFYTDDQIEVWGFPTVAGQELILDDAVALLVQGADMRSAPSETIPVLKELRQIGDVRQLSRAQAAQRPGVKLLGVATYVDEYWGHFFLQDATGAIYVRGIGKGLRSGSVVAVEGVTDPGAVLPMVAATNILPTGVTNLPAPLRLDLSSLLADAYDCAWVELEGVVRSANDQPAHVLLYLINAQGRFEAIIPGAGDVSAFRNLFNARVRLRGVCAVMVNEVGGRRIQLRVPNTKAIQVLDAAPADPFAIVRRSIGSVCNGNPAILGLQRLRVQGMVTLAVPGAEFFLQDATGAIRVEWPRAEQFKAGDWVDVAAFPAKREGEIFLEDPLVRTAAGGEQVAPRLIEARTVLPAGRGDRELITLEGRLINHAGGTTMPSLLVQSGPVVFSAQFETANRNQECPVWRAGSLLRLTGVCAVQYDVLNVPRSFLLRLRRPEDVVVLEGAPWWTPQHALLAGGALVAVVLAVLAWVQLLRHQVREQTQLIRRRLEAEAAMERHFMLIWESSAEGMRLTDALGRTVKVNEAYCRMVEKARPEVEGSPLAVAYDEGERARILDRYQQMFASRTFPANQEHEIVLWNGRKRWFELANSFFEQPGAAPLLLSQFRDITARKEAETERERLQAQLAQAYKMESVGRLAGGVAHDFNNMLQTILGNALLGLQDIPASSPVREYLEEIQRSAERSADLTRQLLAFARKQTVSPKQLALNETVSGMLKMLRRLIGENIELAWRPRPGLWPVLIDPSQVDQILANLCVNARDAISGTGLVTIETDNVTLDAASLGDRPEGVPGDYVLLAVSDNGCGMDEAVRSHLFEPFYTTKAMGKGTGLGLATVFGIVKQNHGFIEVHSEPGQGSRFKVHLPRTQAGEVAAEPKPEPLSLRGAETVLLVEDEEQIMHLGRKVLAQQGYTVLTASVPEKAVAVAQGHPGSIDLLVTDVVMPGLNGKDLRQRIQQFHPHMKCIYMSGYTAEVIAHQGILEEGVQFLQKPFPIQHLAEKVRQVLDAPAGR